MRKRIIWLFVCILIMGTSIDVYAGSSTEERTEIEYLKNGDYLITKIKEESYKMRVGGTKTASKTTNYYNANGSIMWYVKVTATFKYDGKSSACTKVSADAGSKSSVWKVTNKTATKSGNSGTAKASATQYYGNRPLHTYTRSVTLRCDKNGSLS